MSQYSGKVISFSNFNKTVKEFRNLYCDFGVFLSSHEHSKIIIIIIIIIIICIIFSCHRPFLSGTSLEPAVIPTAQASRFTL
jgi:hypothetical protein